MVPVPKEEIFAHHTRPVGKKLYSQLMSPFETIKTVHYRNQVRTDKTGLAVPNRYTIHQSTRHVLSVYQDHSMQGEGKRRFFPPHTATVGAESGV